MFSNTAYEAMYQYIGLVLHSRFIEVLTSEKVFKSAILLIFAVCFFVSSVKFFSRYLPGTLVKRRSIPLSAFFRVVLCLFLGMAVLKVGSQTGVRNFTGKDWSANSYVKEHVSEVKAEYRVSFLFDLLSRSAEELGALLNRVVDKLFVTANEQTVAPNFFFKAITFAGTATIEDPKLRDTIDFYTNHCLERVVTTMNEDTARRLDAFYGANHAVDEQLQRELVQLPKDGVITCLQLKTLVNDGLRAYADSNSSTFDKIFEDLHHWPGVTGESFRNLKTSSLLMNHFLDQKESIMGIEKGSQVPGASVRVFQILNRVFSWDGVLSVLGFGETRGASLAADRAKEFNENLARAPHIAGFVKLILIACFPWLVFAVVAGYWRVLVMWWMVYLSVVLWAPIWTLFYHIMSGIALSGETLGSFGYLNDGMSLYSSKLITSKINYLFAVYSWIQLLIGPAFTGLLVYLLRPLLLDSTQESAPAFLDDGKAAASAGSSAVSSAAGAIL